MRLRQFPDSNTFKQLYSRHNVVPVCREILADMETPVSVLARIYSQNGPAFLFESVEGGERWGRYSFLSTSARAHLRVYKDHLEISSNGGCERMAHMGRPFDLLRDYMEKFNAAVLPDLPRFWGGLVGFIAYEAVSLIEKIPHHLPDSEPLIHFILPDEMLIFDNIRNTLMFVAIVFGDDHPDADSAHAAALSRIDALQARMKGAIPMDPPFTENHLHSLTSPYSRAHFGEKVKTVIEHIKAGDIIQAVISQPFSCQAPDNLLSLYRAQRYINPSPYLFFLHLDGTALVGSSPETMVRLESGVATLRPIAGTRPRGGSEQEDRALADELLKDEKERAEHLMLVDLGRNDLGRIAQTGTVQVTDLMVVERYSHVMHLVSNIRCDLDTGLDAWDLMQATFPAGTLSGAPKIRAMEIISELEEYPRGPYGGAVGYISFSGNMDLAITIRTACVKNGKLTVNAGAGIVYDSVPEKERIETVNKAMAIEKALALISARK